MLQNVRFVVALIIETDAQKTDCQALHMHHQSLHLLHSDLHKAADLDLPRAVALLALRRWEEACASCDAALRCLLGE